MDNMDLDDILMGQRYGENVAKRLRSNSGKVVLSKTIISKKSVGSISEDPFVKDNPKTRSKIVGVGPKRGWSKVKVKTTTGRIRKRKVVHSSESDQDVAKDVSNIILSASKKSAGKKVVQTIESVPIDNASFHLPENAHRWKFIYHRRLELEKELGKEALQIEAVMELIKET